MTHPFHPLHGRVLDVVDRRRSGPDEDRLYLEVEPGRVVPIPAAWTSLAPPDPFILLAGGRSLFRVEDLLRLCDLVADIRATSEPRE